jgi:hypothetical protein
MRNPSGKVVYDRRFNTAALLATYYGSNVDFAGRINWDPKVGANSQCELSCWKNRCQRDVGWRKLLVSPRHMM